MTSAREHQDQDQRDDRPCRWVGIDAWLSVHRLTAEHAEWHRPDRTPAEPRRMHQGRG